MQALRFQRLIVRRCVDVHLLNLMDGSPYHAPPYNLIRWSFPMGFVGVSVRELVITGSRLMMRVSHWETVPPAAEAVRRIFVWD
jgi:hypothetical protein